MAKDRLRLIIENVSFDEDNRAYVDLPFKDAENYALEILAMLKDIGYWDNDNST